MAPQPGLALRVERLNPVDVIGGCDLFDELGLLLVMVLDVDAEVRLHRLLVELLHQVELQLRKEMEVVDQRNKADVLL